MKTPLAALLVTLLVPAAWAQSGPASSAAPKPAPPKTPPSASCEGCGVVSSVKRIESVAPATEQERKSPSGFVATVPLGGGKGSAGSVTEVRREMKPPLVRYEIVVRLDDGRFQVVTQDDDNELRVGDKVRIDRGKVSLR